MATSSQCEEGCSQDEWGFLCRTRVAPKVILFAWKCCHSALRTQSNLRHQRVEVNGICLVCGAMEDGLEHVLMECTFARLVWVLSSIPWDKVLRNGLVVEDWMRQVYMKLSRSDFDIFLTSKYV
ncbi:UNVERIFIED_CONTAM: hypothetical protein Sradi_1858100 [Sesamum radiatum]|uniref:Reverse transcriptase zinc-binding domain-containing protein n=1 Tax=Sesamum radiatum TaxID=300843 RepID=A0AAW2TY65_SESRA